MAEIKIEKKKPIWPWILAALAVLLILFLIFNDTDEEIEAEPIEETELIEEEIETESAFEAGNEFGSTEVESYVTFVQTDSEDKMGLAHNYTSTALNRLVDAIKAKAEGYEVSIEEEMQKITAIQNEITEETYSEQHANSLKMALWQ